MAQNEKFKITLSGGGEETIAAMDEVSRTNIGQSTYNFVKRLMRNPEYRAMIKAKAAEIEASGTF